MNRCHSCWLAPLGKIVFASLLFFLPLSLFSQQRAVQFDPAKSSVKFTLGSTFHTVHGTFKLKSGKVAFDPQGTTANGVIVVDATSGESGNGGRDARMHREILESAKFPEITFSISGVQGDLAPEGEFNVQVRGIFTLHGRDHELTVPAEVVVRGSDFAMDSSFAIPYIKWGLKNPSTFILRASDTVQLNVHAVGQVTLLQGN